MTDINRKRTRFTEEERNSLEKMGYYSEPFRKAINQAIKDGIDVVKFLSWMCKVKAAGFDPIAILKEEIAKSKRKVAEI